MGSRAAVLAGVLLACPYVFALNPALEISQYTHSVWTIRDDAFQGIISAIAQTPDGYLWLGTEFGMLRFDGVRFLAWQPPAGNELPSNSVESLLVSRDGRLWIGTDNGLGSWKNGSETTARASTWRFLGPGGRGPSRPAWHKRTSGTGRGKAGRVESAQFRYRDRTDDPRLDCVHKIAS